MDFDIHSLKKFTKDFSLKPKRTEEYFLLLIEKGKGTIDVDFFSHQIKENIIWFITDGRVVNTKVSGCQGMVIRFNDSFFDLNRSENRSTFINILHHYFCHSPFFEPNSEELSHFLRLFTDIRQEYNRENASTTVLLSYLKVVLVNYQRGIKPGFNSKNNDIVDTIIVLRSNIEQHYIKQKNAGYYAEKQNLSLKRLNEITTTSIGKTVTQLIHERLILEAKRRLLFTEISVAEIAYQIGFEDVNYFYRFFKKRVGNTPLQFRNTSK
ncbi:MAG: helix-turn-helix domain-containing protein [Bacteroidota bacterium]